MEIQKIKFEIQKIQSLNEPLMLGTKPVIKRMGKWLELDDCYAFCGKPYSYEYYFFVPKNFRDDGKKIVKFMETKIGDRIVQSYEEGSRRWLCYLHQFHGKWFCGENRRDFERITVL